jgi:xylulose-5-phosphate/fructose-6-phosphate phosphoketolase
LRDVMKNALAPPTSACSARRNRLQPAGRVYEVTAKAWMDPLEADDVNLAMDGRVMEVLSEHMCEAGSKAIC